MFQELSSEIVGEICHATFGVAIHVGGCVTIWGSNCVKISLCRAIISSQLLFLTFAGVIIISGLSL